jgi:Domain of unknown function (DUF1906)
MALTGTVSQAPSGVLGFDSASPLNSVQAKQYFNKGYRFGVRYVSHSKFGSGPYTDLTEAEGEAILAAGLALMVVQHPLAAGWTPTAELGQTFGELAAANAGSAGLPSGVNVWLDLEGVKPGVAASDTIAFCNAWFAEVEAVGYASGVYIGASPILTADQIYWDLKTQHYWKGGSSAKAGVPDDVPNRGYQLIQRIQNPGTKNEFDSNVTRTDNFGGGVQWLTA